MKNFAHSKGIIDLKLVLIAVDPQRETTKNKLNVQIPKIWLLRLLINAIKRKLSCVGFSSSIMLILAKITYVELRSCKTLR